MPRKVNDNEVYRHLVAGIIEQAVFDYKALVEAGRIYKGKPAGLWPVDKKGNAVKIVGLCSNKEILLLIKFLRNGPASYLCELADLDFSMALAWARLGAL